MHAVIFSGGNLEHGFFVAQAIKTADQIIAADQGAGTAIQFGCFPKAVIGDCDSLNQREKIYLEEKNVAFIISDTKKDETDTELAIVYAIKNGAKKITILGGTQGNRLDHVLANLLFTSRKDIPIQFVNGSQKAWIVEGPKSVEISGKKGDLLSLTALTPEVKGMQTKGLAYALNNESLFLGKPKGISNVLLDTKTTIQFQQGLLLFVQTSLTKQTGKYTMG